MKFESPTHGPDGRSSAVKNRQLNPGEFARANRPTDKGRTAVWQARLVLFVMINIAQLWILSAAIEAALAREFSQLLPLVAASAGCWIIALTIFLWWKPASSRRNSSGHPGK